MNMFVAVFFVLFYMPDRILERKENIMGLFNKKKTKKFRR